MGQSKHHLPIITNAGCSDNLPNQAKNKLSAPVSAHPARDLTAYGATHLPIHIACTRSCSIGNSRDHAPGLARTIGAQTMLWASDVAVGEGTWVKDLHCSLVPLPMLWPSTSVMGLHCSSWRNPNLSCRSISHHSKLFDWQLQRRF